MDGKPTTTTKFRDINVDEKLLKGLGEAGFEYCTPIQEKSLPIALAGQDIAGQAQTGTGKTAAFLVALFHHLLNTQPLGNGLRALVLAPTRELAIQIHQEALKIGKYCDFKLGLAYGGTGYKQQLDAVKSGLDVLVGTPGRIIDFQKQKAFNLRHVQAVVLDEADRMFDLGFIRDIRYLLRRLPPPDKRLGLLFSATLSYRVTELAYEHMANPTLVRIEPERVTSEGISQSAFFPANDQKISLLIGLLKRDNPQRSIVFVNTKRTGDTVKRYLSSNGFDAGILSGDVPQQKRQKLLERFQDDKLAILIATDVAARGLHIPDVSHVYNYDLPQDVEDYVHRIGRTARLGASGEAISLVCEDYVYSLPEIEQYIGKKIPVQQVSAELLPEINPPAQEPRPPSRPPRRKPGSGSRGRNQSAGNRSSVKKTPPKTTPQN